MKIERNTTLHYFQIRPQLCKFQEKQTQHHTAESTVFLSLFTDSHRTTSTSFTVASFFVFEKKDIT